MILDTVIRPDRLNDIQELVFRQCWEGRSYQQIAMHAGYEPEYIRLGWQAIMGTTQSSVWGKD